MNMNKDSSVIVNAFGVCWNGDDDAVLASIRLTTAMGITA
jgi:hypothetical protein